MLRKARSTVSTFQHKVRSGQELVLEWSILTPLKEDLGGPRARFATSITSEGESLGSVWMKLLLSDSIVRKTIFEPTWTSHSKSLRPSLFMKHHAPLSPRLRPVLENRSTETGATSTTKSSMTDKPPPHQHSLRVDLSKLVLPNMSMPTCCGCEIVVPITAVQNNERDHHETEE